MSDHRGDVAGIDGLHVPGGELGDGRGDAHVLRQRLDGGNRQFSGGAFGQTVSALAHHLRDAHKAIEAGNQVEGLHMRQKDGVALAMGQAVEAAKLMRHRVPYPRPALLKAIPARYWA